MGAQGSWDEVLSSPTLAQSGGFGRKLQEGEAFPSLLLSAAGKQKELARGESRLCAVLESSLPGASLVSWCHLLTRLDLTQASAETRGLGSRPPQRLEARRAVATWCGARGHHAAAS